jgi:hypothetical protein
MAWLKSDRRRLRRYRRRELVGDLVGPFAIGGYDDLGRLDTHQRGRA